MFRDKDNWDNKKDQVSCVIGFFCYMYKEFYDTDYVFVPTNPNPFGSLEVKNVLSLLAAFKNDAHEARKYIYWLFKRGINKNTTITHFGYINTPGLIRKYNLYAKRKHILRRESKLPKTFINWCKDNEPELFDKYNLETMNDLGSMLSYHTRYGSEENLESEFEAILAAMKFGLIKDDKLNIGQ